MQLECSEVEGVLFIKVAADRIDASCQTHFKDEMRKLTDGISGRVVLDLENVVFVDSSGLGAIVAAMKMVAPRAKLELVCLTPAVTKLFGLTRLDNVFPIHADRSSALKPVAKAS